VLTEEMLEVEYQLDDEFSETEQKPARANEATITLTYPHWRSGTLPVSPRVLHFFPTAYESPRVRFILVDDKTGEKIPAWVVREHGYVYGLAAWFEKNKLIPGAQIVIRRSKNPGEVILEAKTRKASKDWVRTVLAGSDGGIVFALLRQEVACEYHDRMVIAVFPMLAASTRPWRRWPRAASRCKKLSKTFCTNSRNLPRRGMSTPRNFIRRSISCGAFHPRPCWPFWPRTASLIISVIYISAWPKPAKVRSKP
jgi:hypothetical protein